MGAGVRRTSSRVSGVCLTMMLPARGALKIDLVSFLFLSRSEEKQEKERAILISETLVPR